MAPFALHQTFMHLDPLYSSETARDIAPIRSVAKLDGDTLDDQLDRQVARRKTSALLDLRLSAPI